MYTKVCMINKRISLEKCVESGRNSAVILMSFTLLFCIVQQVDLPLSLVFYKWLLGLESTLTLSDVHHVDPVLAASLHQLHDVVIQKKNLEADASHVRTLWQICSIMAQITR